jgi:DNA-binding Xre family transcriptional regulator
MFHAVLFCNLRSRLDFIRCISEYLCYSIQVKLDWKLKGILEERGVSVYALARAMGNQTHAVKLYRITNADASKRPRRVDFDTLEQIIPALETLTGKPVTPNDLLEMIPEKKVNAKLEAALRNAKPPMTAEMLDRKIYSTETQRIAFQNAMFELQTEKDKARGKVSPREKEILEGFKKKSK